MLRIIGCMLALTVGVVGVCLGAGRAQAPDISARDALHTLRIEPGASNPAPAAGVRGARGAEHCALSIGVFVGGALGFFANPFLGTTVMRFGFMAAALHC